VSEDIASSIAGKPGVMLRTSENVGTDYSLGSELSLDYSPFRWWSLSLGGESMIPLARPSAIPEMKTSFNWNAIRLQRLHVPDRARASSFAPSTKAVVEAQGTEGAYSPTGISARQRAAQPGTRAVALGCGYLLTSTGHDMTSQGDGSTPTSARSASRP